MAVSEYLRFCLQADYFFRQTEHDPGGRLTAAVTLYISPNQSFAFPRSTGERS